MEPVTVGAIVLGSSVFCVGLISAFASRRRREHVPQVQVVVREKVEIVKEKNPDEETELSTAIGGGGYGNIAGGNFASQAARR